MATYFLVLVKPTENKNEEKPLKNANNAGILAKANDNTKDNSMTTTTTTTTRPEKATTTGTNTAPADEENELGKTDKEESPKSDDEVETEEEEEEEESEYEVTDNADDQKSYFNDGTEEVTNMGTDTGTTNEGVSLKNNTDGPEEQAGEKAESNKTSVEEKKEPDSLFGVGGIRNKNQKDRTDIINRVSMEAIEKDGNDRINEKSVEEDEDITSATDSDDKGTTGITEIDSQNNNKNNNKKLTSKRRRQLIWELTRK